MVRLEKRAELRSPPPGKAPSGKRPTPSQQRWLLRGVGEVGGKLPLFDDNGRRISDRTVRSCIENGWAEPWFSNPIKPDWLVCKLTKAGLAALKDNGLIRGASRRMPHKPQ